MSKTATTSSPSFLLASQVKPVCTSACSGTASQLHLHVPVALVSTGKSNPNQAHALAQGPRPTQAASRSACHLLRGVSRPRSQSASKRTRVPLPPTDSGLWALHSCSVSHTALVLLICSTDSLCAFTSDPFCIPMLKEAKNQVTLSPHDSATEAKPFGLATVSLH